MFRLVFGIRAILILVFYAILLSINQPIFLSFLPPPSYCANIFSFYLILTILDLIVLIFEDNPPAQLDTKE